MSKESERSGEEHNVRLPTDSDGGNHLRRRVLKTIGVAGTVALGSWGTVGTTAARSENDEDEGDCPAQLKDDEFPFDDENDGEDNDEDEEKEEDDEEEGSSDD